MPSNRFVQAAFFLTLSISLISSILFLTHSTSPHLFKSGTYFTTALQFHEQFDNLIKDNEAPIIGVLTQGTTDMLYYENYTMIVASYIKFIEAAGGRVIAIPYYLNTSDFERIYQNINGLLIPGGRMRLIFPRNKTEGSDEGFKMSVFAKAAKYFVDRAVEDFNEGVYFPIFGICLGQEAIALALNLDLKNTITKLNLKENTYLGSAGPIFEDVRQSYRSRLFKSFTEDELDAFEEVSKFFYHHKHGISYRSYKESKILSEHMVPLTARKDQDGDKYITSYEMYDYPFFGVQFHPEKTSFEWNITTDRSAMAVSIAHKLGVNFVTECRKNSHTVVDPELVSNLTVYNHMVMGPKHNYDQLFYFSKEKVEQIIDSDGETDDSDDVDDTTQNTKRQLF